MGAFTIYAIKSAICLALLYLPYTLLMRRDTFHAFNRVLLLGIVVLSLVLPLVNPLSFLPQGEMIPNPIESLEEEIGQQPLPFIPTYSEEIEEEQTLPLQPLPVRAGSGHSTDASSNNTRNHSTPLHRREGMGVGLLWPSILVLIYLIGVVGLLGWKTLQLIRLYRYIPSNCLWKDTIDGIKVYGHFDEVCPFSWMNSIVITDEDYRTNPSVMQHERAHIRLHHSWDNLFVSAVEVLQWFNPCIWMLDYSLREVHEYEADAEVLTQGVTLQNYQSLLIRKAIDTSSYAFANGFNHSLLKRRIKMMMKKKTNRWSCTKALYLLPVTAVALAAFATPEFAEKADAFSQSNLEELMPEKLTDPSLVALEEPSSIDEQPAEEPLVASEDTPDIKSGDVITGTVVDENGVPIQAAHITEFDDDGKYIAGADTHIETDINGHFSYKIHDPAHLLRIGFVSQGLRAAKFEPQEIKATSPSLKVVLKPEPGRTTPPVVATGTVTDTEGNPMEYARVLAYNELGDITGLTHPDNNGHFSLRAMNSFPVRTIQIVCDGYTTQTYPPTNEPMKIVMQTLQEADLARQPEITVKGKVYQVNGVEFSMVAVEGGPFMMGGGIHEFEKPVHRVELNSFSICQTEVTQELWEAVMGSNPSNFKGLNMKLPVENVSWNDCQSFITKLNQMTGQHFRLPTEAEWEYAARGGNQRKGYIYSGSNRLSDVGWSIYNNYGRTHVVATKYPNELGLYDMSGNVWEWCQDWIDASYYASSPIDNPTGPSSGTARVKRGGAWGYEEECRVDCRVGSKPMNADEKTGFRLAQ